MSETAENTQWYKGKIPIIEEYSKQHKTLLSTVAGKGFCQVPGFLIEASILLEEVGKNKLSNLNYQIASDAINRELKQTEHDYSIAYKAARIAWELEKQTLLTDLQQEFADLDVIQNLKEEELNRLFIELDIRKLILITTKTTLGLQLEVLKQELIAVDSLTFANEAALINERVVTATAKLAVIPYLEILIEAQTKLLVAEEANIPYTESLLSEKELLTDKKIELIPYVINKANARVSLAIKKEELLPYTANKALAQTNLALKKEEVLTYIEDKIDAQTDLSGVKVGLLSYIEDRIDARIGLVGKKGELLPYMQEVSSVKEQLAFKNEELLPYLQDKADKIIELADKEIELIPKIEEKANALIELANAILVAIEIEKERLAVAVSKAELEIDKANNTLDVIVAEKAMEALRALLNTARYNLQVAKIDRQLALIDANSGNIATTSAGRTKMMKILEGCKIAVESSIRDVKQTIANNSTSGDIEATNVSVTKDAWATRGVASYHALATTEKAEISSKAAITSRLIHLIGGAPV